MRETRFKIQWPNPDTLFLYYLLRIRKREAAFFLNYVKKSIAYGSVTSLNGAIPQTCW